MGSEMCIRDSYQVDLSEYKAERIDIEILNATKFYFDNFFLEDEGIFEVEPILICDNYYLDKDDAKNKIILNLEPDEARYVQETLKLTRTEIRAITRFERGEALISSNNNKVPVVVKASKLEKEMITTDRAELEAILKERQREKTHSA